MNDNQSELKAKYLEYYKQLPVQKLAAESINRDEDTIILWRKQDSDFADQVALAKSAWALDHSKKVRSKEWLLERVMKDHFAERKELTGENGQPIKLTVIGAGGFIPQPYTFASSSTTGAVQPSSEIQGTGVAPTGEKDNNSNNGTG